MADSKESETLPACSGGGELGDLSEKSGEGKISKKLLPQTKDAPVIRTDFSNQKTWEAIVAVVRETNKDGFKSSGELIDDPTFNGLTVAELLPLVPEDFSSFLLIADDVIIREPHHPIVVVDLYDEPGREFRVVPAEVYNVENNLSIVNMDYEDFADNLDDDGVFRGFK